MKTVELPKTSAIGLNISGFFGNAETLFPGFVQMYCIRKHLLHLGCSCGTVFGLIRGYRGIFGRDLTNEEESGK
jgi:hypothetical protein